MTSEPRLSAEFLSMFVAECWEKRPGVFKDVLPQPFHTGTELFQGLQATATAAWQGQAVIYRPYVQGRICQGVEQLHFVPRGHSLQEYTDAISQSVAGESWGVIINNFQLYCRPLWGRMRQLASDLFRLTGIPASNVECSTFLGNYRTTPFGIHRDTESVLTFGVEGTKTLLVWPKGYMEERRVPGTASYNLWIDPQPYAKDALVLEVGPRDVAYWPAGYWHVAYDDNDGFRATVTLSFSLACALSQLVADAVTTVLNEHLGTSAIYRGTWQRNGEAVPREIARVLGTLAHLVEDGTISHYLSERWEKRMKACGFTDVPSFPNDATEKAGAHDHFRARR